MSIGQIFCLALILTLTNCRKSDNTDKFDSGPNETVQASFDKFYGDHKIKKWLSDVEGLTTWTAIIEDSVFRSVTFKSSGERLQEDKFCDFNKYVSGQELDSLMKRLKFTRIIKSYVKHNYDDNVDYIFLLSEHDTSTVWFPYKKIE